MANKKLFLSAKTPAETRNHRHREKKFNRKERQEAPRKIKVDRRCRIKLFVSILSSNFLIVLSSAFNFAVLCVLERSVR
jgi:hypothetical protein